MSDDIQVLLLVHPKHLSDDAQYAIDQYVLRGGHLVVFVDPDAELDNAPFVNAADRRRPTTTIRTCRGCSRRGACVYDDRKVVLDRSRALKIELGDTSFNHPAMLGLGAQELNRSDAVTASLQQIDLSSAGYFDLAPDATHAADSAAADQRRGGGGAGAAGDRGEQRSFAAAARLRARTTRTTCSPHGCAAPCTRAFPERQRSLGTWRSRRPDAEVILVADTDLLTDRLWVDTQSFLGQPMLNAFASNGDFITNLVDNLSGSSALLSIRGRSTSQRPFTRVQALQSAADQKFLVKKQELERELADTRSRLDELQPARGARDSQASAEQKREIEQFLQRKLAISKELRDVQHQLNAEIDALGLRAEGHQYRAGAGIGRADRPALRLASHPAQPSPRVRVAMCRVGCAGMRDYAGAVARAAPARTG